jgi:hypothetical protein
MKSLLYVDNRDRQYRKSQIEDFSRILIDKLLPIFSNIEQEAEQYANSSLHEFAADHGYEDIDPGDIAETMEEIKLEYYEYLRLGRYNVTSSWHATLYELFEQQLRAFLFQEMSFHSNLDFKVFCHKGKIEEIKKKFLFHNLDVEKLACWPLINELRLVCNVVKHGEGGSAEQLRQLNPSIFVKLEDINLMELYGTTILEETLDLNENSFTRYQQAILSFWDEIPERNYSNEL